MKRIVTYDRYYFEKYLNVYIRCQMYDGSIQWFNSERHPRENDGDKLEKEYNETFRNNE
jgi:hypothetical protein